MWLLDSFFCHLQDDSALANVDLRSTDDNLLSAEAQSLGLINACHETWITVQTQRLTIYTFILESNREMAFKSQDDRTFGYG